MSTISEHAVSLSSGIGLLPDFRYIGKHHKGKFSKKGGRVEVEENYEFTSTVEFTGNHSVRITLPGGKEFTLNLNIGEHSL